MIECVIVEDEPRALEIIQRYIKKIDFLDLKASLREPIRAIEIINDLRPQLLFLDISLPEINGFQLFSLLTCKPFVIFTTAYPQHAVKSYEVDALDYLLKPISFDRFVKSVSKAYQLISRSSERSSDSIIFLKSGFQIHRVSVDAIICIEKKGNYLTFYLSDKQIIVRENMSDVFSLVPEHRFVRIHKSFVVSLKHLETIEAHQVTLGKLKIPIGVTYRESFLSKVKLSPKK